MNGPTSDEKKATQLVLAQVLNRVMRLLHPMVPFITEELYQKLPIKGTACIKDQYPNTRLDKELLALGSEEAAFEIDIVKEVVSSIRNIRGENRIKPGAQIKVRLAPGDAASQKILGNNKSAIATMARIESLKIGEEGNLSKCAVSLVTVKDSKIKVIIPLEGLVDLDEEVKRIEKQIEKLTKDVAQLSGRLSNENFVKNAAEDVVAADRVLLEQSRLQVESLREALGRLKA
jgi:valyl-tRNA synthetase